MVNFDEDLQLILLEEGYISYEDYCNRVSDIPKEYTTYALFLKNKGKASKRIVKEAQWKANANWKNIVESKPHNRH